MSTPFAGNPAAWPIDYLIPDDLDPRRASAVNVALQALGDRTAFLGARGSIQVVDYTASGTFVCPNNVTSVLLIGCGGGGGGGAGSPAPGTNPDEYHVGGGGGGGALLGVYRAAVVPATPYAVSLGVGGVGGGPAGVPLPGAGGNTTFGSLATFLGAGFGTTLLSAKFVNAATKYLLAHGGLSAAGQLSYFNLAPSQIGFSQWDSAALPAGITSLRLAPQQIGEGGAGSAGTFLAALGAPSNAGGFAGGARGIAGASLNAGTFKGGGGGGGGAAGPFGAGGNGGNGGDGNNMAPGTDGAPGASAAANTGAGGGGGGAGGADSGAGNTGGDGGAGGSGRLLVLYTVNGE